MASTHNNIPDKSIGGQLTAYEFNQLKNQVNANATDVNTRFENISLTPSPSGADGISAYQVAVNEGFSGTENEWLTSLIGEQGPQGVEGPQGPSNGIVGPEGPAGTVEGLDDILARITSLEQYSPLTNAGNGTVSDVTFTNKEEIVLGEKLQNTVLNSEGAAVDWTPSQVSGLKLWLDASDLTSAPTQWTDKSGQGFHATKTGSDVNVIENHSNGLSVMNFTGATENYYEWTNITDIRTVFWVFHRDSDSPSKMAILNSNSNDFLRAAGHELWQPNSASVKVREGDTNVDGYRDGLQGGWKQIPTSLSIVAVRTTGDIQAHAFGKPADFAWKGNLAELLIFNEALSDADIEKVEGYLAHKWGLDSKLQYIQNDPTPHPYKENQPITTDSLVVNNWTLASGVWDTTVLENGILQGYGSPASIRQNVTTLSNEIYDVNITRADIEEGLVVKLRTSTNVKWLSHDDDVTNEVDVPFNTTARFQVIGDDTPTFIEVDTVNATLQITAVSMIHKKVASGTVEVLANNTIKKSGGVDGWNAGASSAEYINGLGEGYVQFQIAQSSKDIKVGLVYEDVDYVDADPFEMTFSGVAVYIDGSDRATYISGDWFRIKHDSANNQILYQKRDSNLDYQTFYTASLTTDSRDLYLDTSFYHLNGRINNVSMVN